MPIIRQKEEEDLKHFIDAVYKENDVKRRRIRVNLSKIHLEITMYQKDLGIILR